MINSLFKKPFRKTSLEKCVKPQETTEVVTRQDVENMLSELNEIGSLNPRLDRSSSKESISETFELLSVTDNMLEDNIIDNSLDETKSEINSDEENLQELVEDGIQNKDILHQLNCLQCLFTWNLKSNKKNTISHILYKYGDYNLNISSPEFSLER